MSAPGAVYSPVPTAAVASLSGSEVVHSNLYAVKFLRRAGVDDAQQLLDDPNFAQEWGVDRMNG
ncbi:hypothetical protein ACIA8E_24755 [Streptomyces sp. NPDC051664]|uniref:hypothetical protein n=1 Tax=Streptomyces sp. NPDC051664 TaxID=3365668 RepID=UPI0037A2A845